MNKVQKFIAFMKMKCAKCHWITEQKHWILNVDYNKINKEKTYFYGKKELIHRWKYHGKEKWSEQKGDKIQAWNKLLLFQIKLGKSIRDYVAYQMFSYESNNRFCQSD